MRREKDRGWSLIVKRWRWMSIGLEGGLGVGSIYLFVAAPAAFGAGYDSHGWAYLAGTIAAAIGGPALFYYLAVRQERDLEDAE